MNNPTAHRSQVQRTPPDLTGAIVTSTSPKLPAFAVAVGILFFTNLSVLAQNSSDISNTNSHNRPITIYLLRHAESQANGSEENCNTGDCREALSDKGLHRANLLASWFLERRVLQTLDAVYANEKYNSYQTVLPTATLADLDVTQLSAQPDNLTPQITECATIDAILATRAGDTVLIAGDSSSLYDIMGDGNDSCPGLGLLTDSDPGNHRFPKDNNGDVRDYGDVWKVVIRGDQARFVYRVNLETTQLSVIDRAR